MLARCSARIPVSAMQRSGIVGQMNAQAHQAPVFHQAALDDAREQSDVDVAAADQHGDSFSAQRQLAIEHGGEAAAPAPSARVFSRSSRSRIALAISSSSTVTMSSTYF